MYKPEQGQTPQVTMLHAETLDPAGRINPSSTTSAAPTDRSPPQLCRSGQ